MDASFITALAALGGAGIGGVTSGVVSWFNQEMQLKAQESAQDKSLRQALYRDFVEQASQAYIYALQNNNGDVSSMVGLYAKINRMRVLSSTIVIERADQVMKLIVDTYLAPNKSIPELQKLMISGELDVLRDFSEACRAELHTLILRHSALTLCEPRLTGSAVTRLAIGQPVPQINSRCHCRRSTPARNAGERMAAPCRRSGPHFAQLSRHAL